MIARVDTSLIGIGTASPPSVLDYLEFSQLAYSLTTTNSATVPVPIGYSVLSMQSDPSGMTAVAFINQSTNQIVISYRGSVSPGQPGWTQDWLVDDLQLGKGQTPEVFNLAAAFAQSIQIQYPQYTLYVTGHSLGGAESEFVSATLGVGGVTFGAPGISKLLPKGVSANDPILTDFVDQDDLIGNYAGRNALSGNHVGKVEELPDASGTIQTGLVVLGPIVGFSSVTGPELLPFHQLNSYAAALYQKSSITTDPLTLSTSPFEPIDLDVLYPKIQNGEISEDGSGDIIETGTINSNTLHGSVAIAIEEIINSSGQITFYFSGDSAANLFSGLEIINPQGTVSSESASLDCSEGSVSKHGLIESFIGDSISLSGTLNNTGTIDADGGIINASGILTNGGKIEIVAGGDLLVTGTISGGAITADTGGDVQLAGNVDYGADLIGVTLSGDGSGGYFGSDGVGHFTYGELQDVRINARETFASELANVTALGGVIQNNGLLISVKAAQIGHYLTAGGVIVVDGPVSLTGNGTVDIDGSVQQATNYREAGFLLHLTPGADVLTNVSNTVEGSGLILAPLINQAAGVINGQGLSFFYGLTNQGIIEAQTGGSVTINSYAANFGTINANGGMIIASGSLTNSGNIEVFAGGNLLVSGTVSNGAITADTGGDVQLAGNVDYGADLIGVTLSGDGSGGYFGSDGVGHFTYGELQDVRINARETFASELANVTALGGVIQNNGLLISVKAAQIGHYLTAGGVIVVDGPVSLTGNGTVDIDGSVQQATNYREAGFLLHLTPGADALTNVSNTIEGSGLILVPLVNQATGVIDGQGLSFYYGLTNQGIVEALTGGSVTILSSINNTGTIEADGGDIDIHGTIFGGTVRVKTQ